MQLSKPQPELYIFKLLWRDCVNWRSVSTRQQLFALIRSRSNDKRHRSPRGLALRGGWPQAARQQRLFAASVGHAYLRLLNRAAGALRRGGRCHCRAGRLRWEAREDGLEPLDEGREGRPALEVRRPAFLHELLELRRNCHTHPATTPLTRGQRIMLGQ